MCLCAGACVFHVPPCHPPCTLRPEFSRGLPGPEPVALTVSDLSVSPVKKAFQVSCSALRHGPLQARSGLFTHAFKFAGALLKPEEYIPGWAPGLPRITRRSLRTNFQL